MNGALWIHQAGQIPLLGRMLRWWAHQFPENSVVTIRHGYAAGLRWCRHHRYVNGYWLGQYELAIQESLRRLLRPGHTFYDVGANAGFFTLVASRLVGPRGRCIAFDPLPENHESVVEQIGLNGLSNCHSVPYAVGACEMQAAVCFEHPGASTAHLGTPTGGERHVETRVITLDTARHQYGPPHVIKLDIEGAEAAALRGATRLLHQVRPTWLIELHGPECERDVKQLLRAADYAFFRLDGSPLGCRSDWPRHIVATARPWDGPDKAAACRSESPRIKAISEGQRELEMPIQQ
jgi:FkbM family methyltransferase